MIPIGIPYGALFGALWNHLPTGVDNPAIHGLFIDDGWHDGIGRLVLPLPLRISAAIGGVELRGMPGAPLRAILSLTLGRR